MTATKRIFPFLNAEANKRVKLIKIKKNKEKKNEKDNVVNETKNASNPKIVVKIVFMYFLSNNCSTDKPQINVKQE